MSGSNTASTILGIRNAGLITATGWWRTRERMANAISIPLISDSDQGFGNAINVRRTVVIVHPRRVAGIHIEDSLPQALRLRQGQGGHLASRRQWASTRAAVDAKNGWTRTS
ncbi:MAG: isocitrate lyase/phosphoenolpyruvate mutase family protein [Dehalococcoidia bacterium]